MWLGFENKMSLKENIVLYKEKKSKKVLFESFAF